MNVMSLLHNSELFVNVDNHLTSVSPILHKNMCNDDIYSITKDILYIRFHFFFLTYCNCYNCYYFVDIYLLLPIVLMLIWQYYFDLNPPPKVNVLELILLKKTRFHHSKKVLNHKNYDWYIVFIKSLFLLLLNPYCCFNLHIITAISCIYFTVIKSV